MSRIQWEGGAPRKNGDSRRFVYKGAAGTVRITSTGETSSSAWKARIEFDDGLSTLVHGHMGGIASAVAGARERIRALCGE